MLWPLAEAGEKLDGQEIEKALDEPPHAVFRSTEFSRPMSDRQFAHAETAGRRQDRDETVQLAVEPHLGEHLAAIAFEPAVMVVQIDSSEPAHEPVEDTRG